MIHIKTYFRQHNPALERGVVWVQFYVNRKKVNFSTNVKCDIKHWSVAKTKVLSSDPRSADKNLIIESVISRINNVLVKYRLRDRKLTREAFIRAYNRPDDFDTFFAFIKDYQKKTGRTIEMSTFESHKSVLNKMEERSPELHFDDITREWLDDYYAYLRKDLKNCENTAFKNMSTIRKYVKAAYKGGYMDENPFEDWRIKRTKPNYNYLKEDELKKLIELYQQGTLEFKYHKTLEFFLFMCFSSLHVGDLKKLKLEQFSNDNFIYYRVKNKNSKPEPISVPISSSLRSLLKNIVGTRKQGPVFESLPADQTMNNYIKDISESIHLKIGRKISHKTGRHTFATYFLYKTKDLTTLKEILGHSELRETLIYAHVLDESKQEGITCFNSFDL